MLLADTPPIVSDGAAWITLLGAVLTTVIIRAESLSKLISELKMGWFKATAEQDSVVVKELKEQIAGLKSDQILTKAEVIDLKSEMVAINHEQTECLLQEERLWGYITLVYDYAIRQSSKLQGQGLTVEEPPAKPERRERHNEGNGFQSRTKATNARLAKEVAAVVPIPIPPPVPNKGQS